MFRVLSDLQLQGRVLMLILAEGSFGPTLKAAAHSSDFPTRRDVRLLAGELGYAELLLYLDSQIRAGVAAAVEAEPVAQMERRSFPERLLEERFGDFWQCYRRLRCGFGRSLLRVFMLVRD